MENSTGVAASIAQQDNAPRGQAPQIKPNQTNSVNSPRFPWWMHPGSLSVEEKFTYLVKPAFGPRTVVMTAFPAGITMANPSGYGSKYPREWLDGASAFGRNYGDRFARSAASATARFSADALFHEDPRYSRSQSKSFLDRTGHALAFTFVNNTDGGHSTVAFGNFAGAAASGFVANAYLPDGWNDPTHAGQRSLITFGGFAAQNLAQEYAPELGRVLRHLHIPKLPLPPVWWTEKW